MQSLRAAWRVSLQRTRADWPIVAAAALIMLLASTLFSAGMIYPAAASEAGLRQALLEAPGADTRIAAFRYDETADAAVLASRADPELRAVAATSSGSLIREWRNSGTYELKGLPGSASGDQAAVGFIDALPAHATLIEGTWLSERATQSGAIEVVVVEGAAMALGLKVGDALTLVARPSTDPQVIEARLVGVFRIAAPDDAYWNDDEQLVAGLRDNGQYRTVGPFLTTLDDLLLRAGAEQLRLEWRVYPDFARFAAGDAPALRNQVERLAERLLVATGQPFQMVSGLAPILRDAERSLLVSRTGVLLLMAQLGLLAAYAIILTASLLVDHRRVDTALLRSRGAGTGHVALLAFAEGVAIAVPAALVAPWLAVAAVRLLGVAGPLADVGLRLEPRVSIDGYLAAGAAAIVCVALLVLPAALAARGFAAEQGGLSRQETRTFGQRVGLDFALLAITGIALWQLRIYGAPLTRTVQGSLGVDPLLVAAPAIGIVAGGVIALRILPLLAQVVEAAISRGRGLVGSLGARQLARRPLRFTRSALLVMLAMSMGTFALSYAATWSASQGDQAAYQAGADVRLRAGSPPAALPAWELPGALARLAGVTQASPIERIPDGISFASALSADLLALDADTAAGIVLLRPDASARSLDELMQALRAGRPDPRMPILPADATHLRLVPRLDITSIIRFERDPVSGDVREVPLDPAELTGVRLSVIAIVRDANGLLSVLQSASVSMDGPAPQIVLPLRPGGSAVTDDPLGAGLDGPVALAGLGVEVRLPFFTSMRRGVVGVAEAFSGDGAAGRWTAVPLDTTGAWTARLAQGLGVAAPLEGVPVHGATVELTGDREDVSLDGNGDSAPAAVLSFVPEDVGLLAESVPAIANRAFLEALGTVVGDSVPATVDGRFIQIRIAGAVESFPTTDPERPLLVLDEPTLGLLRLAGTTATRSPTEWWLATGQSDTETLASTLRASPFMSADVVTATGLGARLRSDPVALGIVGALTLGSVVTGMFAIVGLTVSAAVAARERRTEFALLRALGLSGRQLSGTLWLENGSVFLVSLLAGTGVGLLVTSLALPFATVTQLGTAPVPPVIVLVPWDGILMLIVVNAVAMGVAVLVIGNVLRRLGVGSVLRMGED